MSAPSSTMLTGFFSAFIISLPSERLPFILYVPPSDMIISPSLKAAPPPLILAFVPSRTISHAPETSGVSTLTLIGSITVMGMGVGEGDASADGSSVLCPPSGDSEAADGNDSVFLLPSGSGVGGLQPESERMSNIETSRASILFMPEPPLYIKYKAIIHQKELKIIPFIAFVTDFP